MPALPATKPVREPRAVWKYEGECDCHVPAKLLEAFVKELMPENVFASERIVEEAAVIVPDAPRAMPVPLTVMEEFVSLLLAIEPASIVFVTEPVSVVYTPLVTVPALPVIEPEIVLEKVCVPPHVLPVEVPNASERVLVAERSPPP